MNHLCQKNDVGMICLQKAVSKNMCHDHLQKELKKAFDADDSTWLDDLGGNGEYFKCLKTPKKYDIVQYAAIMGKKNILKLLAEKYLYDVNNAPYGDENPLLLAISKTKKNVVKYLLDLDFHPTIKYHDLYDDRRKSLQIALNNQRLDFEMISWIIDWEIRRYSSISEFSKIYGLALQRGNKRVIDLLSHYIA